jgi:hypothetical protein
VTGQRSNPASAELLAQLQEIRQLVLEQLKRQAGGQAGGRAA